MPEEISFGAWLRKQRRALDLSQQAFADQVGCAEVTVRRIEAGTLKPSKELAAIFLGRLGIPVTDHPQWISFARGVSGFPFLSNPSSRKPTINLPAPLTTFIGREKEQFELVKLISKHRLVTLTGPGGVGKTRLSLKLGEQIAGNFPNGVWLVELAPIIDPSLVPAAAARTFGLLEDSKRLITDILCDYLREKTLLLILDNCEHVLDACAQFVDTALKRCPNLKVLTTSREVFGVLGEAVYPVPSLELPDTRQRVGQFREYESIQLFEERAQLIRTDFSLTIENVAAVAQICTRLDGIPLAIELAAARVNTFSTEQIAARLQGSFSLLTSGNRTALPRHRTLRAAIDWSYDLLSPAERILFQRLSVFVNGWTPGAAERICSDVNISSTMILDLLTQLTNKSLVIIKETPGGNRYGMLETIREYAHEKLDESGDKERVRQCHLEYFMMFAEQAEPKLKSAEQLEWLDRLEAEHDNLRAALHWTYKTGDIAAMSRLAERLFWFWNQRSYLSDGRAWLERALTAGSALTRSTQATLFSQIAYLARMQGDFDGSRKFVEQSIVLWRSLDSGDQQGLPFALALLEWLVRDGGDPETSRFLAEEGVVLARQQGDAWSLAFSLISLGMAAREQEVYDLAQSTIEESLAIWQELGDLWGVAHALHSLALVNYRRGDYEVAYSFMDEALDIRRQLGSKLAIGYCLHDLGVFALAQGNIDGARPFFEEDLVLFREIGDKSGIVLSLQYHGLFARRQGDYIQAQTFYEEGLKLARETGPIWVSGNYLLWLADLAADRGQLERAVRLCSAASTHMDKNKSFWDAFEYSHYKRIMNLARLSLGEKAFSQSETEGRAMTLNQAVEYALRKS